MSEKRFTWEIKKLQHLDDEVIMVVDNENRDWKGHILNVVDKLNEQQFIIEDLQDLYGDPDYENAQLKLENKKLQDKIDWLCEKYDYPNNKGVKNE